MTIGIGLMVPDAQPAYDSVLVPMGRLVAMSLMAVLGVRARWVALLTLGGALTMSATPLAAQQADSLIGSQVQSSRPTIVR